MSCLKTVKFSFHLFIIELTYFKLDISKLQLFGLHIKIKQYFYILQPAHLSRASSISSLTDSTLSLNIITVTLNMDTVNFLGISIVGQSNQGRIATNTIRMVEKSKIWRIPEIVAMTTRSNGLIFQQFLLKKQLQFFNKVCILGGRNATIQSMFVAWL